MLEISGSTYPVASKALLVHELGLPGIDPDRQPYKLAPDYPAYLP